MSLTREASNISSAEHDGATVNAAAAAANANASIVSRTNDDANLTLDCAYA